MDSFISHITVTTVLTGVASLSAVVVLSMQVKHKLLRRQFSHIRDADHTLIPYIPFIGQGVSLSMDTGKLYRQLFEMCRHHQKLYPNEDSCMLWFSPITPMQFIFGANDVEIVFKNKEYNSKSWFYCFIEQWLGTGLLTSNNDKWAKRRRMLTPAFHFNILKKFCSVMNKHSKYMAQKIAEEVQESPTGVVEMNLFPKITMCALDIISESAMGVGIDAQKNGNREYVRAIEDTGKAIMARITQFYLWPRLMFDMIRGGRPFNNDIKLMHEFTNDVIRTRMKERDEEKRKEDSEYTADKGSKKQLAFLDLLLDIHDDGDIDFDGIREEVDTFMFEGHDTTATAMNMMAYCLGRDLECQRKMQAELDAVLPNVDDDYNTMEDRIEALEITPEDLLRLEYTDAVGRETLRLYPSVPISSRLHPADKLAMVGIGYFAVNQDPRRWKNPDKFNPDRFLDDDAKRHAYQYIPFSAGYRNCIGQRFAQMEMKIQLAYLMKFFKIESIDAEKDLCLEANLITRPRVGVNVKASFRDNVELYKEG